MKGSSLCYIEKNQLQKKKTLFSILIRLETTRGRDTTKGEAKLPIYHLLEVWLRKVVYLKRKDCHLQSTTQKSLKFL